VSVESRPIVAISSARVHARYDGRDESIDGSNAAYSRAVLAAGGAPLLLPYGVDISIAETVLEVADALLLTGGDDVVGACPSDRVDRRAHEDPVRDVTDRALLRAARGRGMPILGVCRGMQLLAVMTHGAIARVNGHALASGQGGSEHEVVTEPSGGLEALLGPTVAPVPSLHSFVVSDPGLLHVVARSLPDGAVEAVMGSDPRRFELGVQWHPELATGPLGVPVIALLVAAATRYAAGSNESERDGAASLLGTTS
jgi:putative glutamine amidotransferase